MDQETIKMIESIMGEYTWWFVAGAVALFFKGAIDNFASGITFYPFAA